MMAAWPMIVSDHDDPEKAKAGFGIVERDALNKAGEHFLVRGFLVVLHRSCLGCPSV
jgi:hypothetical protein